MLFFIRRDVVHEAVVARLVGYGPRVETGGQRGRVQEDPLGPRHDAQEVVVGVIM